MIMVNAIYFKADWAHPFRLAHYVEWEFHYDKDRSREVPTMKVVDAFRWGNIHKLQACFVEIPYQVNMKIVL